MLATDPEPFDRNERAATLWRSAANQLYCCNPRVAPELCFAHDPSRSIHTPLQLHFDAEYSVWMFLRSEANLRPFKITQHNIASLSPYLSLSTSRSVLPPLQLVANKATEMLASRAFVHHYEKFGVGFEEFAGALATTEQIISAYSLL